MVVQRGMGTWTSGSSDNQQQTVNSKHDMEFDHGPVKTASAVPESNKSSPQYRCNVAVTSSLTTSEQQNLVEWKNTFNMRQVILSNLTSSHLGLRPSCRPHLPINRIRGQCVQSSAKSLDLLRQNVQAAINKEIDSVIKKYLEKFFQPAVDNIRNNLGNGSVTEEHVRDVCRQILEDAKQMYSSSPHSRGSSPSNELSDSETGSIGDYRFGRPSTRSPLFRKQKESDTDSEASHTTRRKRMRTRASTAVLEPTISVKVSRNCSIKHEGPKWDPTRILKETLFVMGARANKVLGFGQTRGRLYNKHPGLVRYTGDQEDKEWLAKNNLMPPSGGKAYVMILEDIKELAETEEYRNSPNLLLHELKGFEAPDFMLKKIRAFINHLRTDDMDSKEINNSELCDAVDSNFSAVHGRLSLGTDFVSSAMTPPATVLDSGPPTPSDALDLLDCPTLASQNSDGSPYMRLQELSPETAHNSLITQQQHMITYSNTLSALLAGQMNSDNSQEAVE